MGGIKIVAATAEERYKGWFDLLSVCRASAERMSFDVHTGDVWFDAAPADGDTLSLLVANLATDTAAYTVEIHPIRAYQLTFIRDPWSVPLPPVGNVRVPLCSRGAGAWPARFTAVAGPSELTQIDIVYDANDHPNNTGYKGYDGSGAETPVLSHHLLTFALASAGQIAVQLRENAPTIDTAYFVNPETSLNFENAVRSYGLFPPRVGPLAIYIPTCTVQPGKKPDPPPPGPDPGADAGGEKKESMGFFGAYRAAGGQGGGGGCFVATAAFGSPYAPEVDLLRGFRDMVLRQTRVGKLWFDRFYRRYNELSPEIADRMRQDSELAELLGVGIVQPYVGWLEAAMTMPDAALDDVPEPWRTFLAHLIERLDSWSGAIGMPEDIAGLSGLAAARELAIILRYGFRDHGRRLAYLDRLQSQGALPLRLRTGDLEEARRIFARVGLTPGHVNRVIAATDTAEEDQ